MGLGLNWTLLKFVDEVVELATDWAASSYADESLEVAVEFRVEPIRFWLVTLRERSVKPELSRRPTSLGENLATLAATGKVDVDLRGKKPFALMRLPGHHATPTVAMGVLLFELDCDRCLLSACNRLRTRRDLGLLTVMRKSKHNNRIAKYGL